MYYCRIIGLEILGKNKYRLYESDMKDGQCTMR